MKQFFVNFRFIRQFYSVIVKSKKTFKKRYLNAPTKFKQLPEIAVGVENANELYSRSRVGTQT